ncbi:MAG TPA: phospholipid carrier-dependent glycosyltransferase [Verrucomicrobiae bacterium]|nr:phospholipid carrier-dependent glycosyltransferase [Verrucomicrobiae bacterium]
MEERFSVLLNRTCLVGCLLGVCGTWYFLFGLAGYVSNPWLNFSVVTVLLATAVFFICHFLEIPRQTHRLGKIIWAAIFVILIVEIILGLLPPTSRDELTHHLAIPKLYAKASRIIEVPIAPYSYYPMLIDMLYTPWVYWGYDFVPKWIHALFGFLTGLLLYAYCGGRMNAVYGLLGFFFFVSTPIIARLSHWGYIDLGITFYTTASLLCLLRWREERESLQWLTLAALSLGFALATKPNGLVAALLISVMFLLLIVKPPRKRAAQIGRELLLYGGLTLLPFLPWLVKNWSQTGNPLFPLLANFFVYRGPIATESASFGGIGILVKRELLYGENFWQILGLPLRVFFSGRDDNPQFFDGVLTPILIILLPWAFKGKWLEDKKLLASFALLFLLYAIFLVDLRIRYILSIVPPLVILAVYGIFNVYLRIKRPVYLFVGLIAFVAWHGSYLWHYVRATEPFGYLSGSESRDTYLERMLPEYAAFRFINQTTAPAAKIYLLFVGRRGYYCERDYFHDGGELPGYLLGVIRAAKSPDQIDEALKRKQITHLMVREELLVDFLTHNLTPAQAATWSQFAQSRLTLNFRDRGHAVYQLHA